MKRIASILSVALLSGCASHPFEHPFAKHHHQEANHPVTTEKVTVRADTAAEPVRVSVHADTATDPASAPVEATPENAPYHYPGYSEASRNSYWGWWGPWNGGFYFPAYYGDYVGSLHAEFQDGQQAESDTAQH